MTALATPAVEIPPDRRRWIGLAVIIAAQFMVVLDVAIMERSALPNHRPQLRFSQDSLQWVVTASRSSSAVFLSCSAAAWPTCSDDGEC